MVRTQIQLPDELYAKVKRLAQVKEWSLAETLRRAAEELLDHYPQAGLGFGGEDWSLPEPMDLGTCPLTHAQIKELAQMTGAEETILRARRKRSVRAPAKR